MFNLGTNIGCFTKSVERILLVSHHSDTWSVLEERLLVGLQEVSSVG